MAGLAAEEFILYDTVPGVANPNISIPTDGFDATTHSGVATAAWDTGTKILGYQDVTITTNGARQCNRGGYTMVYGQYLCSTTAADASAGEQMTLGCGSTGFHGQLSFTKELTAANGAIIHAPCVFAAADMTPSSYGFFWCEGVCPQEDVTGLDQSSTYVTDGSVAGGQVLVVPTASSIATLSIDVSDNGTLAVGFAYVADA